MSPLFEDSGNDPALSSRRATADAANSRRSSEIDDAREPEREVTLNTGIVLALFFALALLCAVFFGFGYSMGRKSVPPPVMAEADPTAQNDTENTTSKPSPASSASPAVPGYMGPTAATDAKPAVTPRTTATVEPAISEPAAPHPRAVDETTPATQTPAPVVRVAPVSASASGTSTAAGASAPIYVQVAAVSHQEDADVLLGALRRRGYTVLTRSDPNDRLTHVQLGPFTNRKDADTMRQRLAGDGYNAILK